MIKEQIYFVSAQNQNRFISFILFEELNPRLNAFKCLSIFVNLFLLVES